MKRAKPNDAVDRTAPQPPAGPDAPRASARALAQQASDLRELREAARTCRACELWERGTQTVFGEGTVRARILLVGEQPGDREDREGHPFVGPAGAMLDRALEEAGLDRADVFVTNVVKHFNWEPRGKRRIHLKPRLSHILACRPWLDAEIAQVRPEAIVCLGATAAQALLGKEFRITRQRGQPLPSPLAPLVIATAHPSSILRAPDAAARREALNQLVSDLKVVTAALGR